MSSSRVPNFWESKLFEFEFELELGTFLKTAPYRAGGGFMFHATYYDVKCEFEGKDFNDDSGMRSFNEMLLYSQDLLASIV